MELKNALDELAARDGEIVALKSCLSRSSKTELV
jgi:hypothetical protein